MSITLPLNDYDLKEFRKVAADFGAERYAYVVTPNVDHIIRYYDEQSFRDLYASAEFILLDSRFLSGLLRLTRGIRAKTCPGSDLTAMLFAEVIAADDKVILIGSSAEAAAQLKLRYGLRCLRHLNPPMGFIHDPAAVEECLDFIESEGPFRFCLLAVGCPQQEILAQSLQKRGKAKGMALCIGASINFLTGSEKRAPQWIQDIGFEWLFRLAQDPGRLAKRYLLRGPRIFRLLPHIQFELANHSTDQFASDLARIEPRHLPP